MPKRSAKLENACPWAKIAAGVAASAMASSVVKRLPFGRVLIAAALLIVAAIERNQKRPRG